MSRKNAITLASLLVTFASGCASTNRADQLAAKYGENWFVSDGYLDSIIPSGRRGGDSGVVTIRQAYIPTTRYGRAVYTVR